MKKAMVFFLLALSGCQGSSVGSGPGVEGESDGQQVLVCRSNAGRVQVVKSCLGSSANRAETLADEISKLPVPGRDHWYSLWLDFASVQFRFGLSASEVSCLKKQFCRGKF